MIRNIINKTSSRDQIQIKEVKDGVLVLANHQYRIILETSVVNFELKSEDEQDQIIDSFQNFLNSLPCSVQILIRTREIDIDGYVEDFLSKNNHETDTVYKDQLKEYTSFIRHLVTGNKILTRKFYLVISYEGDSKDFSLVKEQLKLNQDIVKKSLEKLGMKSRRLGNLEILDLFYKTYNPTTSKLQPLTNQSFL